MIDALIHLRVPPELKARWVRESRAAGMRLTDWVIQRVEAQHMHKITPITLIGPDYIVTKGQDGKPVTTITR